MPDTKISADSAATNLTGLELAGIQGGANMRVPATLFGGALSVPTGTINGSNTVFTLASVPNGDILVFLNGLTVLKSTYTVVGTTLTFTTAPETGDALQVLIGASVGGGSSSPTTTPGDLIVRGASVDERLAQGSQLIGSLVPTATTLEWLDPRQSLFIFDDFVGTLQSGANANGTGAAVSTATTDGAAGRPGILTGSYGTTTAGRSVYGGVGGNTGSAYRQNKLGGGLIVFEASVRIPTLSDATDTFYFCAGFCELASAPASTYKGLRFEYSHSINSGGWRFKSNDSAQTEVNSGSAVVAGTWYRLTIVVNDDATSATGYIDGTSLGTITTNIPAAAYAWVLGGTKSAGTTARTWEADYYLLAQRMSTAR